MNPTIRASYTLLFAILMLSLAACASSSNDNVSSFASATTPKNQATTNVKVKGLPGLATMDGRGPVRSSKIQPLPQDVIDLLLTLPATDFEVPANALQQTLGQARGYVVEIPRASGQSDRRISAAIRAPIPYSVWVRSFESAVVGTTGYLIQIRINCSDLLREPMNPSIANVRNTCTDSGIDSKNNALRAYRKVAGKPIEDVTAQLKSPENTLGIETLCAYEQLGANPPFLDDSRLDLVPTARWVVEADPEQPLPNDAHTFYEGSMAHGGFLIWADDHFETRNTVPRTLWPCLKDDELLCEKDDRFVTSH